MLGELGERRRPGAPDGRGRPRRRCPRRSSNTRPSTRTRRRTSATCATPRSATRSSGCCAFRGAPVEVQNYIDDTGVQVADVVVGFRELEQKDLDGGARDRRHDALRLLLLGPLRARDRVVRRRTRRGSQIRADALHDIEHGGNETAEIAAFIADRIVRCHLKTMARMNIGYDLLTWEGDILRLHFWAHAFEFLKETGAVFLQTEGRLTGCWVMRIEDEGDADARGRRASRPGSRRATPRTPATRRETAREGDRPLGRDGHLRRQGHGVPVLEVRAARQGLPLPAVRARRRDGRPLWATSTSPMPADARRTRRSAARVRSTTSSTPGSPTCRSC